MPNRKRPLLKWYNRKCYRRYIQCDIVNTYVAEEWDAMSAEERTQFADRVYGTNNGDLSSGADDVDAVGVDDEGVSIDEIGIVETEDGDQMIVAVGSVGGEQVAFADMDCDGCIDVIVDSHGQEITGVEVTVDQLCELAMNNESYPTADDMYAGLPDYMNDADTSAFA